MATWIGGTSARVRSSIGPERLGGERARAPVAGLAHSARPLRSLRRAAAGAARLGNQHVFSGRRAVDEAQAEIAREAQRREVVGEQAVHHVHAEAARRDVEAPLALVGRERSGRAGIEAEPHFADDRLGERRDVAQARG